VRYSRSPFCNKIIELERLGSPGRNLPSNPECFRAWSRAVCWVLIPARACSSAVGAGTDIESLTTTSTHCEQSRDEPNRKDLHTVNSTARKNCGKMPSALRIALPSLFFKVVGCRVRKPQSLLSRPRFS